MSANDPLRKIKMSRSSGIDPSNSQSIGGQSNRAVAPGSAGIDTCSFVFRFDPGEVIPAVKDFDPWFWINSAVNLGRREVKTEVGWVPIFGSASKTLTAEAHLPGGIRWGITPRSRSIWVEGRAAAMLTGDKENYDLVPSEFLRVAALRAAADLADLFGLSNEFQPLPLYLGAKVGVRRLDVTSEISCSSSLGLQLLRGFANVSLGGERTVDVWGKENRIETINFRERSRKVRFRIYDKGSESGSNPPGERLRFERQLRWSKKDQPLIYGIETDQVIEFWREGLVPWLGKDRSNVWVLPIDKAGEKLISQVESGSLRWEKCERLLGSLLIAKLRGENWWKDLGHRDAGYRRLRELRSAGIIVGNGSREIDLGEALEVAEQSLAAAPPDCGEVPERKKRVKKSEYPDLRDTATAGDDPEVQEIIGEITEKREAA